MRFQLYTSTKTTHTGFASCVSWLSAELVATCGDDRRLIVWNTGGQHEPMRVTQLSAMAGWPTAMHYRPTTAGGGGSNTSAESSTAFSNIKVDQVNNCLAIGTSTGNFHLVPLSGGGGGNTSRMEKGIEAHRGSIIAILWSNDISTLATAGEDGLVKVWSRNGMLRTTLNVTGAAGTPVYAMSWSSRSDALVTSKGNNILIKPLAPQAKTLEWTAHEGLIISLDWGRHILSGGEDGRIKVWDSHGALLYQSPAHPGTPLTAAVWSPNDEMFAVATRSTLRLYEAGGVNCLASERISTEGIYRLAWSTDSNQLAVVCANGQVLFAYLVDRTFQQGVWVAKVTGRRTVRVSNVSTNLDEVIELKDCIVKVSFEYDHLVVVTLTQCYIYQANNLATPIHFDTNKNVEVQLVRQAHKIFLLLSPQAANLYSYNGRFLKTLKMINTRADCFKADLVSLNNTTLAHLDGQNMQTVYFVDLDNVKDKERRVNSYTHMFEVHSLRLSRSGHVRAGQQMCALVDKNADLYLVLVHTNADRANNTHRAFKLASVVRDLCWHVEYNMLATLDDKGEVSLWLHPYAVFVDSSVHTDLVIELPSQQLSSTSHHRILELSHNRVLVQRADAAHLAIPLSPFVELLHLHRSNGAWPEAVKMTNFIDKSIAEIEPIDGALRNALWTSLAVMALEAKEFGTAEIAYAAVNKLDKVLYLNSIKALGSKSVELRNAEHELVCGNVEGAERMLLAKGYVVRAVMLNLELFRWKQALSIATANNAKFQPIELADSGNLDDEAHSNVVDLVHLVLSCRQHYLTSRDKSESIPEYVAAFDEVDRVHDWSEVETSIKSRQLECSHS